MRVRGKHLASAVAALTLCVGSALFTGVLAGDSPAGFWYGADGSGPGGSIGEVKVAWVKPVHRRI